MKSILFFTLLFLLTIAQTIKAEDHNWITPNPFFYTLTNKDGLPSDKINTLFRDSTGFIWIGTNKGLARFDGNHVQTYPETAHLRISKICSITDHLLLATTEGLKYFNPLRSTLQDIESAHASTNAIEPINNSSFFVGSDIGLSLLHEDKATLYCTQGFANINTPINDIVRQDSINYWLISSDELINLDYSTSQTKAYRLPISSSKIKPFKVLETDGRLLFIGTDHGLIKFDPETGTFQHIKELDGNIITHLDCEKNILMVATEGNGVKFLDLLNNKQYSISTETPGIGQFKSDDITTLLYDDGRMWIGTLADGVVYNPLNDDLFSTFRTENFDSSTLPIETAHRYPDNSFILGSRRGLYYIDADKNNIKKFIREESSNPLRSNVILSICNVGDTILIGTAGGGMYFFDKNRINLKDFCLDGELCNEIINQIVPDNEGNVWVASGNGLYHVKMDGIVSSKIPLPNVTRILLDTTAHLWIASEADLYNLDTTTNNITRLSFSQSDNSPITDLYQDSKGNIYVLRENSINIFDTSVKPLHGWNDSELDSVLKNKILKAIKEIKNGEYWIVTENSVVRYNTENKKLVNYNHKDGLPQSYLNSNICLNSDSTLMIASHSGLIMTDLTRIDHKQNGAPPSVVAVESNGSMVNNIRISSDKVFYFPIKTQSITLTLSSLEHVRPGSERFSYRIEDEDTIWRPINETNNLELTELHPGVHTIEFRNDKSGETSSFKIGIRRTYEQMYVVVSAITIAILLAVFIIYHFYRLHIQLQHNRKVLASAMQTQGNKNVTQVQKNEPKTPAADASSQIMIDRLLQFMDQSAPYRNPKLAIRDVASALGVTDLELSQLINNNLNQNWTTFVNTYRVTAVKDAIDRGELARVTLESIAEECGFGSKTTFYRVFKSVTGLTPLEYCTRQNPTKSGDD